VFFAGLWEPAGEGTDTCCAILTEPVSPAFAFIHDRQPVVLDPECRWQWPDPAITDREGVRSAARRLNPDSLIVYPVSTRVNRAANDGADLIMPEVAPVIDPPERGSVVAREGPGDGASAGFGRLFATLNGTASQRKRTKGCCRPRSRQSTRDFGIDIETCSACGIVARTVVCIEDTGVLRKVLTYLGAKGVEPETSMRVPRQRRLFDWRDFPENERQGSNVSDAAAP
jgi:hypothetical protein